MVISIASQKGGTGKTTTSLSLATGLAWMRQKVLLIDMDSQANASKILLPKYVELKKEATVYETIVERRGLPVHQTDVPNLSVAPAHILLSNTDVKLTTAVDHREARLRDKLELIKGEYDQVIIDCPPALGWLSLNAFTASDGIIVVIAPGYFELDSIGQINNTIREVQEVFNPNVKLLGYLFNMSDSTVASRESLKILRQTYTGDVFKTVIPRNVDVRAAQMSKTDLFSFNVQSKSAEAYRQLIKEIFYEKEA